MYFYDIHTHSIPSNEDVVSILNHNVGESGSFCGLNLQHQLYSIGLHPWKIRENNLSQSIDFIEKNAIFDAVKSIGECGLDKACETPWHLQEKAFTAQIKISESIQKPLIIHCVKAFDELIALKREIKPHQTWIIHGFRGKPEQANQLVKQGFFFSFGPIYNEESLSLIPQDRFFLETDHSGKTIESVYQKAAVTLGLDIELLGSILENNLKRTFIRQ
ncbi:MAG: TatD family hydrolase [Dysgonamonadaceae bacterium]|jgi:TatD DNase family protein|nr:TatD family hydrolase [Dysgonamonadaceae bacterium]